MDHRLHAIRGVDILTCSYSVTVCPEARRRSGKRFGYTQHGTTANGLPDDKHSSTMASVACRKKSNNQKMTIKPVDHDEVEQMKMVPRQGAFPLPQKLAAILSLKCKTLYQRDTAPDQQPEFQGPFELGVVDVAGKWPGRAITICSLWSHLQSESYKGYHHQHLKWKRPDRVDV